MKMILKTNDLDMTKLLYNLFCAYIYIIYTIYTMNTFYIFLITVVLIETIICAINIIRQICYGKTVLHYNVAAFFMIIGQSCLFLLGDWKRADHTFVYLNECQLKTHDGKREICYPYWKIRQPVRGMDQGIIVASDFTIYQSLGMALVYTFTICHCLYAANRKTYDHSLKWIEYIFSSSLQTMILYSLFGQVGQVIWIAIGFKMFAMMSAYGIEAIMIHEKPHSILSQLIKNWTKPFLYGSFLVYFIIQYCPLFIRNYSGETRINGTIFEIENSEKPVWAYLFFASTIICEALFPYLLVKNKENLLCVKADMDFCLLSMISKITFNTVLIIGLRERSVINKNYNRNIGVGIAIICLWTLSGILYWRIPYPQKKSKKFCHKYDLLLN